MSDEVVWAQNHILLAEVVSTTRVPVLRGNTFGKTTHVTVRIIRRYTPDEPAFQVKDGPKVTFSSGSFVLPAFRAGDQTAVAAGDAVIVVTPKVPRPVSYFLQPGTYMGYADIGAALHRISRLRMPHAAHDEFLNAALEVHPLLAKYALNRLLVAEAPPDDDFVQRLLAARDSPEIDTEVALLASRLLSRLTEKPPLNRDEYVWLKTRLMAPTTGRPKPLQPFIRRILEYSDERAETIELFVNIGLGADFPDETRLACMDALIEPEVFKYDHPDVHSHTIVRALLQLLEHDTTKLRGGITGALWKMGMHVSHLTHVNTELREILEEIATALRDAVKRESVVGLRILMTNALARISRGTDVSAHEEDG